MFVISDMKNHEIWFYVNVKILQGVKYSIDYELLILQN